MKGLPGSEPDGIAGDCFWILVMYAGEDGMTTRRLHERIAAENDAFGYPVPTRPQMYRALERLAHRRRPPLIRSIHGRWMITDHGSAMLDVWVPDGDG